jgi:ABC-2 type transport system ATP-binding protein
VSYIELKNVEKHFGTTIAVKNISISLEKNKIYGLLGRNGAGKSTLLNMMTNKLFPTKGQILLDGQSIIENDHILSRIYCMTEKNLYPDTMKVKTAFHWTKKFYPMFDMAYALELSKKFELNINKKVKELSTGYASIFKLIAALSCNAETILFDEPVLGLDAYHRDLFYKELISNYSKNPKTIVISTHLIEEVADIIEDVIIIKEGEVILNESVEKVLNKGYTVSGPRALVDVFIVGKQVIGFDMIGGLKSAYLLDKILGDQKPKDLEITKLDLQKMFIHLTNS